jgi:WD40 repeat protein
VGGEDGCVRLYEQQTWRLISQRTLPGIVYRLDMGLSPQVIAAPCHDGRIYLLETPTLSIRGTLCEHGDLVGVVRFAHNSRTMASGGRGRDVLVWDADGAVPRLRKRLALHRGDVRDVSFSHDGLSVVFFF